MTLCSRCGGGGTEDQPPICTALGDGPCEACRESAAIYDQIIQLEEEITKLKEKRRVLATAMNESHDPFIHKLPSEVGSHIFHLCLPSLELTLFTSEPHIWHRVERLGWGMPFKLGAVCRKWRQLAWAMPNLWVAPRVEVKPLTPSSLIESLPSLLCEWLGRSGLLPLTIFFSYTGHDVWNSETDNLAAKIYLTAADQVIEVINYYWGRLENLFLDLEADLFERIAGSMEPNKLTSLVLTVRNAGWSRPPIPRFITHLKPSPKYLTLVDFRLTSIDIGWDNVTHVALGTMDCKDIVKFIRRAPALQYCHIFGLDEPRGMPLIDFDTVTLLQLHSLHTSDPHIKHVLDVINVPCLEKWTHNAVHDCRAMISLIDCSNCILKVLDLGGWFPIGLHDLLRETPSLEQLTLRFKWRPENTASMDDILTCMIPGGGATSELFLPHLLYFECGKDTSNDIVAVSPFTWDRIPQLYSQGHRRSLTLKAWAHQSHISDETALELLQLVDEGVDLRIIDWETHEDFLEKFRSNFNMASNQLELQPSPAESIPTHGPDSLAKKHYPNWDYPQQTLGSVKNWASPGPYEALPAGKAWKNFFHVLEAIGITPPDISKPFSPTFGDRVYNELYDRTDGLLVKQVIGVPVGSKNREKFIILGYPEQTATEEQKKTVAHLMGLSVNDIIKVYVVD